MIAGGTIMEESTCRLLDMKKIQNKERVLISAEEALIDVIPIEWNEDVLNGYKQLILIEKITACRVIYVYYWGYYID